LKVGVVLCAALVTLATASAQAGSLVIDSSLRRVLANAEALEPADQDEAFDVLESFVGGPVDASASAGVLLLGGSRADAFGGMLSDLDALGLNATVDLIADVLHVGAGSSAFAATELQLEVQFSVDVPTRVRLDGSLSELREGMLDLSDVTPAAPIELFRATVDASGNALFQDRTFILSPQRDYALTLVSAVSANSVPLGSDSREGSVFFRLTPDPQAVPLFGAFDPRIVLALSTLGPWLLHRTYFTGKDT
jgi:hypothetical protein